MIWESYPWKEELFRIAARLERKTEQKRWTDRTDANLEKDVFVACYAVRKLAEAQKLSEDALSRRVSCTRVPVRPEKRVTHYNWHKLDELYDFERQGEVSLGLRDLCNQLIHSYVFCPVFGENGLLQSVAVSSDWKRYECVYLVLVLSLVRLFRDVGIDDPCTQTAVWDDAAGDHRTTNR